MHRWTVVRDFVGAQDVRLGVERRSAYASELNPVESLWAVSKNASGAIG